MSRISRREFAARLPVTLAVGAMSGEASGQATGQPAELKLLSSGTFKPDAVHEAAPGRMSRQYLTGMLKAGNIRLEIHESMQVAGAVHEPEGTHLHNEIWCVQHGTASLFINGTEHTMKAGDVGLVCAGDRHWIKNLGADELAYFVIAVGPPE